MKRNTVAEKRAEARMKGYVGEAGPECGNFHHGPQRHAPDMRHLRRDDGVQLRFKLHADRLQT